VASSVNPSASGNASPLRTPPALLGFTEGFGTRDLIDAKALLEELEAQ